MTSYHYVFEFNDFERHMLLWYHDLVSATQGCVKGRRIYGAESQTSGLVTEVVET